MKRFLVPRNVGDKMEISGLGIDQIIIVTIGAVAGFLTGYFLYTFPIGVITASIFGRISKKYPDGFLLHAGYWFGILSIKGTVAPYKKDFYT